MADYDTQKTNNTLIHNPYDQLDYQTSPPPPLGGTARATSSYDHASKHETPSSNAADQARAEAENRGVFGRIVLYAAPVFVNGLAVATTADLQNLLTISQILTTVFSKTVPLVLGVLAYQLASEWLKASAQGTDD
ncbi:hypothetical protein FRB97_009012 [Tulasnella sp. 331]|nr:hypothetical protein FRB97_009012 [Tulasnella sp. 331]